MIAVGHVTVTNVGIMYRAVFVTDFFYTRSWATVYIFLLLALMFLLLFILYQYLCKIADGFHDALLVLCMYMCENGSFLRMRDIERKNR